MEPWSSRTSAAACWRSEPRQSALALRLVEGAVSVPAELPDSVRVVVNGRRSVPGPWPS